VRTVLHLHWTNKILERARDDATGRAAIAAFLERLDRFTGDGGRLVWTVHNEVPHDARLPELEAELQAAIVKRATVVHVMSPATLDVTASTFPIPKERALVVPHPSYAGAYPDLIGRDEARHRLGLDQDAIVYGLFGAIKPYKGLDQILDALDALVATDPPGSPPRRLLVGGPPDRSPGTKAFLEKTRLHPLVTVDARRIPADELAGHLRATDVAVLPYERGLNSGVLLLALTFGLPVVVPDLAAFDDIAVHAVARRFAAGDATSLADGLRSADELLTPSGLAGLKEAAARITAERDPDAISRRFIAGLLDRLA
jgi:glycosyltransferase involved in cell wall biosynthesis